MKHLLRAASLAALCTLLLCATACYEAPTVKPDDDSTNHTVVISDTQMSTTDLLALHDSTVKWSDMETYIHTMTGDNTAQFIVMDESGANCTLDVTIDRESGLLSEATLSYESIRENFLDESIAGIVRIFHAMNETEEPA